MIWIIVLVCVASLIAHFLIRLYYEKMYPIVKGDMLDRWGYEFGVVREIKEKDKSYRKRLLKVIRGY